MSYDTKKHREFDESTTREERQRFWHELTEMEEGTDWHHWPTVPWSGPRSVNVEQPLAEALVGSLVGRSIVAAHSEYASVVIELDDGRRVTFAGHWTNTSEDCLGVSYSRDTGEKP